MGMVMAASDRRDDAFRWLPKHGEPFCNMERLTQAIARLLVWLPMYAALTLVLGVALAWWTR